MNDFDLFKKRQNNKANSRAKSDDLQPDVVRKVELLRPFGYSEGDAHDLFLPPCRQFCVCSEYAKQHEHTEITEMGVSECILVTG